MEAVAEGAARAEREPGEGRSGDPDFFEIAGLLRLSIQGVKKREESPSDR